MGSNTVQSLNAGAADAGESIVGSIGVTTARDNAISLANSQLNTGLQVGNLSGSSSLTINSGDPSLANTFAQTVKDLTTANAQSLSELVQSQTRSKLPNAATDLATPDDTTEPTPAKPGWIFWSGLAAVALGLWLLFSRK